MPRGHDRHTTPAAPRRPRLTVRRAQRRESASATLAAATWYSATGSLTPRRRCGPRATNRRPVGVRRLDRLAGVRRHDDLAAVAERRDPRRGVDVEADVVAGRRRRVAAVHADPHAHRDVAGERPPGQSRAGSRRPRRRPHGAPRRRRRTRRPGLPPRDRRTRRPPSGAPTTSRRRAPRTSTPTRCTSSVEPSTSVISIVTNPLGRAAPAPDGGRRRARWR